MYFVSFLLSMRLIFVRFIAVAWLGSLLFCLFEAFSVVKVALHCKSIVTESVYSEIGMRCGLQKEIITCKCGRLPSEEKNNNNNRQTCRVLWGRRHGQFAVE